MNVKAGPKNFHKVALFQSRPVMVQEEKRALHVKLRRAMLGEHLREEQGNKEASTQTEHSPAEAGTLKTLRSQASARTPRQRAQSVLQTQAKVGHHVSSGRLSQCCLLMCVYICCRF